MTNQSIDQAKITLIATPATETEILIYPDGSVLLTGLFKQYANIL